MICAGDSKRLWTSCTQLIPRPRTQRSAYGAQIVCARSEYVRHSNGDYYCVGSIEAFSGDNVPKKRRLVGSCAVEFTYVYARKEIREPKMTEDPDINWVTQASERQNA